MLALAEHRSSNGKPRQAIQRLPEDVVVQIKSSIAINSLNDVALELIKNSLDAAASRIILNLDFRRGSCTVEDDGLGILPSDFTPESGLGKLYHTSRYHSGGQTYGKDGRFLASVAALSLVTIISRHHDHYSTNSLVLHNSKCISRAMPAPAQHTTAFNPHGTSVSVRDLFGSMPVRVKQRATFAGRAEFESLCNSLKRDVVALVIAYGRPVEIRAHHVETGDIFHLRRRPFAEHIGSDITRTTLQHESAAGIMQHSLFTLIDAKFIAPDKRKSWVPVSASMEQMTVKGAICTDPAPNKAVQFISLGKQPLSAASGHNELFEAINRTFSNSAFGTIDDAQYLDEKEVERRKKDKRYKSDGVTDRQLRQGHKGVDRWPMFFLHINIARGHHSALPSAREDSDPSSRAITEALSAIATQWLSSQKLHVRKPRRTVKAPSQATPRQVESNSADVALSSATNSNLQYPPPIESLSGRQNSYSGIRSFNELSRIKSASPSFYDTAWTCEIPERISRATTTPPNVSSVNKRSIPMDRHRLGGNYGLAHELHEDAARLETCGTDKQPMASSGDDNGVIIWQDPVTMERHLINSRTGTVIPSTHNTSILPDLDLSDLSDRNTNQGSHPTRERLTRRPSTHQRVRSSDRQSQSPGWLQSFLQSWDNPVFRTQERRIPQTSMNSLDQHNCPSPITFNGKATDGNKMSWSAQPLISKGYRLSKEGLLRARIVAQVDKKFILIRMPAANANESTGLEEPGTGDVLVLVDQHAADERVKVESLLAELCTYISDASSIYRSNQGHACRFKHVLLPKPVRFIASREEVALLNQHAARFADWSILYDINDLVVTVTVLPPVVAERLKASPQLVIDLLRSAIHKSEHIHWARSTRMPPPAADESPKQHSWLSLMGDCPTALLDLVNSRACRSAIMFNDILDPSECAELLAKLAACAFPFACAHGRPSMVPIVGLDAGAIFDSSCTDDANGDSYATAFRKWQDAGDGATNDN